MTTVSAVARLIPSPPARVERRKTNWGAFGAVCMGRCVCVCVCVCVCEECVGSVWGGVVCMNVSVEWVGHVCVWGVCV